MASERVYKPSPTQEVRVPFSEFVSRLVAGLDIPIEVSVNNGDWVKVHEPIEETIKTDSTKLDWLKKITLSKYFQPSTLRIEEISERLRPIYVNGALVGLAALSLELGDQNPVGGLSTVGGFLPSGYSGIGGQRNFYGYMEQLPNSAKREPGKLVAPDLVMQEWISDQLKLLAGRQLLPIQLFALTHHLCDLNFDPTPYVSVIFIKGQQASRLSVDEVFELMKSEPIAFFKFHMMNHVDSYVQQPAYENYSTFRPTANSSFLSLELDENVPKNPNSFIGCLYRRATTEGYRLNFETRQTNISSVGGAVQVVIVTLVRLQHAPVVSQPSADHTAKT
jgi:hypothetical protein